MRVLIADDNRDVTRSLVILLRTWGFEPVPFHDGLTALQSLREAEAPTIAVLDGMMPGMNGIDVCRESPQGYRTGRTRTSSW